MLLLLDSLDSENKGISLWKEEVVPKRCVPENKEEGGEKDGARKVKVLVGGNILEVGGGLGDGRPVWR